jgi:hypothetical protein
MNRQQEAIKEAVRGCHAWHDGRGLSAVDARRTFITHNPETPASVEEVQDVMNKMVETGEGAKDGRVYYHSSRGATTKPWRKKTNRQIGIRSRLVGGTGWVHNDSGPYL